MPPARQGIPTASRSFCSTFGWTVQAPQRRSDPNQETISDSERTAGSSPRSWASEVTRSVRPEGEWEFAGVERPGPSS